MNSLQNLGMAISQFLTGPFGVSMVVCAVAAMFLLAMFRVVPAMAGFLALAFGSCALSAAWAVNTFLGA